jgi:predicted Fe-Mo cluster-binding NifX family protein
MKITVSAKGKSLDSDMDPRFGRSSGFILFDNQTGNANYLDNSAQRELAQGTGIKTAQMIAEAGTEVLITGQLGPKAARVLSKSGIKIYACTGGTVREAIQALEENRLKELREVQPGPGKMGGRGKGGGGGGRGRL